MTAEHAQREPTMEEILASIRRIISEEDQPAEAGGDVLELAPAPAAPPVVEAKAPPRAEPAPAPAAAPAPRPAAEPPPVAAAPSAMDDELIVEDFDEPSAPEPVIAPPPAAVAAPAPQPAPSVAPPPRPVFRAEAEEGLTGEPAAAAAAGSLGKLMGSMLISSGNTLDDVVRALLKPMLKEWLDAHLPAIVEAEVEKEIERIRRLAR